MGSDKSHRLNFLLSHLKSASLENLCFRKSSVDKNGQFNI